MTADFWEAFFAGELPPLQSLRPLAPTAPVSVGSRPYGAPPPAARVGNALALPWQQGGRDELGGVPNTREATVGRFGDPSISGVLNTASKLAGGFPLLSVPLGIASGAADVYETNETLEKANVPGLGFWEGLRVATLPNFIYSGEDVLGSRLREARAADSNRAAPGENLRSYIEAGEVSTNALADAYNAVAFGGRPGDDRVADDPYGGTFDRGYGDPGYY